MGLLAAIGLILPAVTGVAVFLTPLAATSLVVMMLLAVLTHIHRRDPGAIVFTAVRCWPPRSWRGAGFGPCSL